LNGDSVAVSEGDSMRPKKHETTGKGDLFRARLDQIINMKHELVSAQGQDRLGLARPRDRTAL
jgi:IS5 family transposase